jgi:protein phosphatase
MIRFSDGAATDIGHVRRVNEDSYLASPPLYAVADGMGGHGAGDVASALAIQVLTAYARPPLSVGIILTALDEANGAIIRGDQGSGMGTTVAGLALVETAAGGRLMVFNVGDSRVYRLAGGQFDQVTEDHSEVQELVRLGAITLEQARTHPRRNIVTRALGGLPDLRPDHWLLPPVTGDRYLICSDGLHGELPDDVLHELLAAGPPQQVADTLVRAANEAGGHDNVTALVIEVIVDSAADVTTADTVDATAADTGPLARLKL